MFSTPKILDWGGMDFQIFFAAPRRSGVEKNHAPPQGGVDWGGATEKSQSNFECLGWSGVEWIFIIVFVRRHLLRYHPSRTTLLNEERKEQNPGTN